MRSELVKRVIAEPDSDEPRWVFADWLETNGELDRAELIRRQIDVARLDRTTAEWARARDAAEILELRLGPAIRAELPAFDGLVWGELDRGFVGTVRVGRLDALFEHGAGLAQLAPVHTVEVHKQSQSQAETLAGKPPAWVRRLRIVGDTESEFDPNEWAAIRAIAAQAEAFDLVQLDAEYIYELEPVLADFALPACRSVRVTGNHTAATAVSRLAARADLTELRLGTGFEDFDSGYFQDPTLREAGARALAAAPRLARLERLGIGMQAIGDLGLELLVGSLPALTSLSAPENGVAAVSRWLEGAPLTRLDLSQNALGDGGVAALAASPRLGALRTLKLDVCEIGAAGLAALTRAPFWSTLRALHLRGNTLTGAGAILAAAPAPAELHTLVVSDADLAPEDLEALLGLDWVQGLDTLDLSSNGEHGDRLTAGLAALRVRRLGLAGLGLTGALRLEHAAHLDLSRNPLDPGACFAGACPELRTLRLEGLPAVQTNGAPFLAHAPRLGSLALSGTPLSAEAVGWIAASSSLARLVELSLARCSLSDDAVDALLPAPWLPNVRRLGLGGNDGVTEGTALALLSRLPDDMAQLSLPGNLWRFTPDARQEILAAQRSLHRETALEED